MFYTCELFFHHTGQILWAVVQIWLSFLQMSMSGLWHSGSCVLASSTVHIGASLLLCLTFKGSYHINFISSTFLRGSAGGHFDRVSQTLLISKYFLHWDSVLMCAHINKCSWNDTFIMVIHSYFLYYSIVLFFFKCWLGSTKLISDVPLNLQSEGMSDWPVTSLYEGRSNHIT